MVYSPNDEFWTQETYEELTAFLNYKIKPQYKDSGFIHDIVSGFICKSIASKLLSKYTPGRGSFKGFIITSLCNYMGANKPAREKRDLLYSLYSRDLTEWHYHDNVFDWESKVHYEQLVDLISSSNITTKEKQLIEYLKEGITPAEIARIEGLTYSAVNMRVRNLRKKLSDRGYDKLL